MIITAVIWMPKCFEPCYFVIPAAPKIRGFINDINEVERIVKALIRYGMLDVTKLTDLTAQAHRALKFKSSQIYVYEDIKL